MELETTGLIPSCWERGERQTADDLTGRAQFGNLQFAKKKPNHVTVAMPTEQRTTTSEMGMKWEVLGGWGRGGKDGAGKRRKTQHTSRQKNSMVRSRGTSRG